VFDGQAVVVAEVSHETVQIVIPVVIAGDSVDGPVVAVVGAVELVLVVGGISGGIDNVSHDDHEVSPGSLL
jgi:hypothetical protein